MFLEALTLLAICACGSSDSAGCVHCGSCRLLFVYVCVWCVVGGRGEAPAPLLATASHTQQPPRAAHAAKRYSIDVIVGFFPYKNIVTQSAVSSQHYIAAGHAHSASIILVNNSLYLISPRRKDSGFLPHPRAHGYVVTWSRGPRVNPSASLSHSRPKNEAIYSFFWGGVSVI